MTKENIYLKINQIKDEARYKKSKYTKKDMLYISLLSFFGVLLIAGLFVLGAVLATNNYKPTFTMFVCIPFSAMIIVGIMYIVYRYQFNQINKAFNVLLNPNNNSLDSIRQAISLIIKKDNSFFNNLQQQQIENILLK